MRVLSTSVRGLEMPVDEFPHSARGPPCVFVVFAYCTSAHVQQICTVDTLGSAVL